MSPNNKCKQTLILSWPNFITTIQHKLVIRAVAVIADPVPAAKQIFNNCFFINIKILL